MTEANRAPLRVLLVTAGGTIPQWLFKCVEEAERAGATETLLLAHTAGGEPGGLAHLVERGRSFAFRLYRILDRRLFRRSPDALAPVKLAAAFPNRQAFPADDPALCQAGIDVLLDPFSLVPDGPLTERSRYGAWTTQFGDDGDPKTQSVPAFWEVVEGRPITQTRLCLRWKASDQPIALHTSVAATDRRSPARCQNHMYWRLSAALARKLRELWEDPEGFRASLKGATPCQAAPSRRAAPGNAATLRAWTALTRRYVADKWTHALFRDQWALAYQRGRTDRLLLDDFRILLPPSDRAWADPFPVREGTAWYVFHEELPFATGKGSIVVTVMDGDDLVGATMPVLEREYHLSYPFLFRWDGELFMIPEAGSGRRVELYRCVQFPWQWRSERVLLSGLTAFDPTVACLFGRWWLFLNIPAYGTAAYEELHLFHADSPLGPWMPHPKNPIKSDVRSARPAGRIFERQGHFYRPAQDGSTRYGYGVSINRILRLDPEAYEETEVDRITPNGDPQILGVHTLNLAGDLTMIDCLIRRPKLATPRMRGR